MRVLIADDDVVSLRLLQRTLERAKYEVTAVTNGRRAMEVLCLPEGPRLAMLDWVMPEFDGPSVCRAVRKARGQRHVHLVLLTSKDSKQDVVRGLESGADDYLIKPFDPEELKARLRSGLRILQLEDKLLEAREEMRYKATHDSLTSLLNRGTIVELLSRELIRTQREKKCTIVVMADLDHFKAVNDTYGHPVGDEVLREVARRLLSSVRSYDFVGRYGGEEFLLVLNNCTASKALSRAEEIRNSVSRTMIPTSIGPLSITFSLGAAANPGEELKSVEEVLCRADRALYEAKAAGRNCSRTADMHNEETRTA
ncbi:MAG TPA: diguanylate cyclase [Terracidiphilus sp.]|jgi:diguanylate cyclase (GGDEF)-like protein